MVKKKGHPFLKGKCLNCGSSSHLKAACNRPMASGRNIEAEYAEEQEAEGHQEDEPEAPADESEPTEDDPNAAGMKGK
eukprot:2608964-Amphidinium_carterae.1